MGIVSFLSGMNPIAAIADSTIGKVVEKVLDFIPDPEQKAKAQLAVMQMNFDEEKLQMDAALAQMNVNAEEAKNEHIFVSGWRPFIGWICGMALGYNYILMPLATFIVKVWMPDFQPPKLDIIELIGIMTGMLGLTAARSYDKSNIVAAKQ